MRVRERERESGGGEARLFLVAPAGRLIDLTTVQVIPTPLRLRALRARAVEERARSDPRGSHEEFLRRISPRARGQGSTGGGSEDEEGSERERERERERDVLPNSPTTKATK